MAISSQRIVTPSHQLLRDRPGWAPSPSPALLTASGAERVQEAKAGPYALHTKGQAKALLSLVPVRTLTSWAIMETALLCVETWGGGLAEAPPLQLLESTSLTLFSLLVRVPTLAVRYVCEVGGLQGGGRDAPVAEVFFSAGAPESSLP